MKIQILYRPESEHARAVEEFARDYSRSQSGSKPELVSLDTKEGDALAKLYDVVQYPAIIVTANDGQLLKFWQGEQLPLMSEVASYAGS